MGDLGNVVVSFCGISVVCCGAVVLAFFLLARVTGRTMLLPVLSMFGNMFFRERDEDDEDDGYQSRRRSVSPRRDFQVRRQSLDEAFDAAFSQYEQDQGGRSRRALRQDRTPEQVDKPAGFADFDAPDFPDLRDNARRPRRDLRRTGQDSAEDEILGGLLDEDGDSFPDL